MVELLKGLFGKAGHEICFGTGCVGLRGRLQKGVECGAIKIPSRANNGVGRPDAGEVFDRIAGIEHEISDAAVMQACAILFLQNAGCIYRRGLKRFVG